MSRPDPRAGMETAPSLLDCAFAAWSPGIGDPTLAGWLTVALYLAAAAVAARVAWRAPFPWWSAARERVFWAGLALGLALLAVNKQLDLQSLLTALGRCHALAQGWYEDRRVVQALFILGLAGGALAAGLFLLWLLRDALARAALPLLGLVLIAGFVLIRAVGFHGMDRLIDSRLELGALSLRINAVLEMPGPLLILVSGLVLLARGRHAARPAPRG